MEFVQQIMNHYKFDAKSQRTLVWLAANSEFKFSASFNISTLYSGYKITGQIRFDLKSQIDHWPGNKMLTSADLDYIEDKFKSLVEVGRCHGTIHPTYLHEIMGKFIHEKHVEALSIDALAILHSEEL